ncbi:MAG: fumarylacetoacetate hydrolase family protein [Cryomorphaceae bacterium]|jgi:2-keto-4-pentenoate hydratase/2-oxohepta-3-ene-1,7-dioic acid hydratase in catechol pathway|nr:fumarylacetoacetate hydrolase family protein [Cryomorphaceae bacterium]
MKIICIGRNYSDHAKEMQAEVPAEPVFFLKPDTALLKDGQDFYYPDFTQDVHYECELVVRIDKVGKNISEKFAHKYYSQIGLGLDFTARDLQQKCKEKGLPWEIGKAFDQSAALGNIFLDKETLPMESLSFELRKNGDLVQSGNSSDMIFNIDRIIAYVSQYITLKTGDLIYTGTPAGVGPIAIDDLLEGFIEGEKIFSFSVK